MSSNPFIAKKLKELQNRQRKFIDSRDDAVAVAQKTNFSRVESATSVATKKDIDRVKAQIKAQKDKKVASLLPSVATSVATKKDIDRVKAHPEVHRVKKEFIRKQDVIQKAGRDKIYLSRSVDTRVDRVIKGGAVLKKRRKQISVRLDKKLYDDVCRKLSEYGITLNELVRSLLSGWV